MNPFSSRCCQHNHAFGWPYFAEHLVLATPDNGVAAVMYSACEATVKVADGQEIILHEETHYPFEETIRFTVSTDTDVRFPMYFRIPSWTAKASVSVNGKHAGKAVPGKYVRIDRIWKDGDRVTLEFPMSLSMRRWQYGIPNGRKTRILKSGRQQKSILTVRGTMPWSCQGKEIRCLISGLSVRTGRRIPSWTVDGTGLCSVLPDEGVKTGPDEPVTLVPMGAARLRILAFPNVTE